MSGVIARHISISRGVANGLSFECDIVNISELNMFPITSTLAVCLSTENYGEVHWLKGTTVRLNVMQSNPVNSNKITVEFMNVNNITSSTIANLLTNLSLYTKMTLVAYDTQSYESFVVEVTRNYSNMQTLTTKTTLDDGYFTNASLNSKLEYVISFIGNVARPLTIIRTTSSRATAFDQIFCDSQVLNNRAIGETFVLLIRNKYYPNLNVLIRNSSAGEQLETFVRNNLSTNVGVTYNLTNFVNLIKNDFGNDIDTEVNALLSELTMTTTINWFDTSSPSSSPSQAMAFNPAVSRADILVNIRNIESNYQKQVVASNAYSEDLMNAYTQVFHMLSQFKSHNKYIENTISTTNDDIKKKYTYTIVVAILFALGIGLTFVSYLYKSTSPNLSMITSACLFLVGLGFAIVGIIQMRLTRKQ